MIHVDELYKSFGSVRAVAGVSFDVAKGEVVGLLGPNGAGKTTTMRILTGYLTPDQGAVTIDGLPVTEQELETRSMIGYLPESAPLYLDLEVTAYLTYIGTLRGVEKGTLQKRLHTMVELCGLGDVVGRPIGELSKGYRQRVGLAQAMIHEPPILILDEPTSGLDPNQIAEIRQLIRDIGKKRTIILSTHILQEVEATCSRAMIISGGKLVGEGTLAQLLQRGSSGSSYFITARAARAKITAAMAKVKGVEIGEWLTAEHEERQRLRLKAHNGADHAEAIFQAAVENGFPLVELKRESATLEQVFRELTQ